MSESPIELVRTIDYEVQDANVIPTPIDPTLSIEGDAADAKATGDAIAGVIGNLRVNTKAPVNNAVTLYGSDIAVTGDEGAQTIAEAIEAAGDKAADDIMYDADNMVTVADALDAINEAIDSELSAAEIDDIFDEVFGGE